jgi:DNA-binding MarR family transcriptional regulator
MSVRTASRTEVLDAVGRAFKRVIAAQRRMRGREAHHPGQLRFAQYGLLFGLYFDQPQSLTELAEAADVSPATAAEMLDSLAAAGLVERVRSSEDKRVVLTSLTERGRALVAERRAQMEPKWRATLRPFSDEELLTAAAVLDALREMFDALGADTADASGR